MSSNVTVIISKVAVTSSKAPVISSKVTVIPPSFRKKYIYVVKTIIKIIFEENAPFKF